MAKKSRKSTKRSKAHSSQKANASKYKFRRGDSVGNLEAESDALLLPNFVKSSQFSYISDTQNSKSIIRGRTGAGKSAILRYIESDGKGHMNRIDPYKLSISKLSNSNILQFFRSIGIKLDLFYKLLWRHVIVVNLLNMYRQSDENKFDKGIRAIFRKSNIRKKYEKAERYLEEYEDQFWQIAEKQITEIEEGFSNQFKTSANVALKLLENFEAGGNMESTFSDHAVTKAQVVHKAKHVISSLQIDALNQILAFVEDDLFAQASNNFYILIDDLDTDWIDDDIVNDLIRSLLEDVRLFSRIPNVKVVVALRANIFEYIYTESLSRGGQREKLNSYIVDLDWTEEELKEMMSKRVESLTSGQSKLIYSILPRKTKQYDIDAYQYIFDRVNLRPRNFIDFVNKCIDHSTNKSMITWDALFKAEKQYSRERLQAIHDEWKENYGNVERLFQILYGVNQGLTVSRLVESSFDALADVYQYSSHSSYEESLQNALELFNSSADGTESIKNIVYILYRLGILGIKLTSSHHTSFYEDGELIVQRTQISATSKVYVHYTYVSGLNVHTEKANKNR